MSRPQRTDRGSTVEAGPTRRPPAAGSSGAARTRIKLPTDPYSENLPRRSRLRGPLIVGGVIVALFAVIALVNQGGHKGGGTQAAGATASASATPTPSPTAAPTSVTTPYDAGQASDTADGVPVGYLHSSSGAEAAAANYVVAFNSASMVYSSHRARLVNAIADPAIASSLEGQFDAAYAQIDTNYGLSSSGVAPAGQTYVERAAPVGVSLVSDSGNTATVSVWLVSLSGIAGTNSQHAIEEDWSTVTVTLNWTHGDWKWFSFVSSDGPAPLGGLQTPAAGSTLQAAVSKFGGLRYGR